MSRLADETDQEAWERAGWERRKFERTLMSIVNGQRGSARVLRERAMLAVLGGGDPSPWLRTAERREAQALQTAGELVRLREAARNRE